MGNVHSPGTTGHTEAKNVRRLHVAEGRIEVVEDSVQANFGCNEVDPQINNAKQNIPDSSIQVAIDLSSEPDPATLHLNNSDAHGQSQESSGSTVD